MNDYSFIQEQIQSQLEQLIYFQLIKREIKNMISEFLLAKFSQRLEKLKQQRVKAKNTQKLSENQSKQKLSVIQIDRQKEVRQTQKLLFKEEKLISYTNSLNDNISLSLRAYNQDTNQIDTQFSNHQNDPQKTTTQPLYAYSINQTLPVYALNNLIYISDHLPSHIVKLYIQELSQKYRIQFNNILTSFLIEQGLIYFFQRHDISFNFNEPYICSQLEQIIPTLLEKFYMSDWNVLKNVVKAIFNRFQLKVNFDQRWLINILVKNKRQLREGLVKVEMMLRAAKGHEEEYTEKPTQIEKTYLNYKNLVDYLNLNPKTKLLAQNLDKGEDKVLSQSSYKDGISTNLSYFYKLVAKSKESQIQRISALEKGVNQKKTVIRTKQEYGFEDQILFSRQSSHEISNKSKISRKIMKKEGKIADKSREKAKKNKEVNQKRQ